MTKEEKELLFQDLCARLPYGVMIEDLDDKPKELTTKSPTIIRYMTRNEYLPYLRPMSSMTEEEEKQLQKIHQNFIVDRKHNIYGCAIADAGWVSIKNMNPIINFFNANHFDYRGLIPMGLALEAPEGMYKC